MLLFLSLLFTLVFFAAAAVTAKKQIHMFQLNSYQYPGQFRWFRQHKAGLIAGFVPLIPAVIGAVLGGNALLWDLAATVLMALIACFSLEKKAKKPLVCTARVKRLIATLAVLTVLCVAVCYVLGGVMAPVLCKALLFALLPLWVLLANLVNTPVEALIRRHYIRDAERILAAADTMKVIGVTGSFGKTSVKYFLSSILRAKYDVLMTPGNFNTTMGVVKTVREHYSPTNQLFVCEMGARHVGDIKEICDLVHPDAGIITAIGAQHLETFHTLDNIKHTKYELADSLAPDAPLFLNGDDENVMSVPHKDSAIIYGIENKSGYYADQIQVSERGTTFTLHTPSGETAVFSTRLLGRHNVLNLVGASAVAHTFGVSLEAIGLRVKKLEGVPHRLQLLKNPNGAIIDDAYNSNPQGASAALEVLSMFDGTKILVTPGMVELGERQDACNFDFGAQAARVCDLVVLVGANQTRAIREGLLSEGYPEENLFVAETFEAAMAHVNGVRTGAKKYILLENDLPDNY